MINEIICQNNNETVKEQIVKHVQEQVEQFMQQNKIKGIKNEDLKTYCKQVKNQALFALDIYAFGNFQQVKKNLKKQIKQLCQNLISQNIQITKQFAYQTLEVLYKKYFMGNDSLQSLEDFKDRMEKMEVEYNSLVVGPQKLNIWHNFSKNSLIKHHKELVQRIQSEQKQKERKMEKELENMMLQSQFEIEGSQLQYKREVKKLEDELEALRDQINQQTLNHQQMAQELNKNYEKITYKEQQIENFQTRASVCGGCKCLII